MVEAIVSSLVTAVVVAVWERYLGGTDKIDANSTIELVSSAVLKKLGKK